MTEMHTAVKDALERSLVAVAPFSLKTMPKLPRPSYLPDLPPWKPDIKAGRAQVAALRARYPRNMKGWN